MNIKYITLQVTPKGSEIPVELTYGYSLRFRKWEFKYPGNTMLVHCKGGEQGTKVAHVIAGSLKRNGAIDNFCRANINRIIA